MILSPPKILCSIVSHDQATLLQNLLNDLESLLLGENFRFVITENTSSTHALIAANRTRLADTGQLRCIQNSTRLGFGSNHNQGFARSAELFPNFQPDYFVVLNPDIRISQDVFTPLATLLQSTSKAGIGAPEVITSSGSLDDSVRYTPTLSRLLKKLLFNDRGEFPRKVDEPYEPDWMAGMFLMFDIGCFRTIQGFDEKYFLYYEDADVCLRTRAAGFKLLVDPRLRVEHSAQRASRHDMKRMIVHLLAGFRFLATSRGG